MFWINSSNYIVKIKIDLGKGRQPIVILPSQIIELPDYITKDVIDQIAPQLIEYISPKVEIIPEETIEALPVEVQKAVLDPTQFKAKRGRKPNKGK